MRGVPRSVKHINGDRRDNRWINLRLGFKPQKKAYEMPRPMPTAYEGIVQVGDRFEVLIETRHKVQNLSLVEDPEDAHAAYCEAGERMHGRSSGQCEPGSGMLTSRPKSFQSVNLLQAICYLRQHFGPTKIRTSEGEVYAKLTK